MQAPLMVNIEVKGNNLQKAHLHPPGDVCVQYENNPANTFRDIIQILYLSTAIN